MQVVNYSSKINFSDSDKSLIKDHIRSSLRKSGLNNDEIYNVVSCRIKSIIKDFYLSLEDTVRKDLSIREIFWNLRMNTSDYQCITTLFTRHYPEFSLTLKSKEKINRSENPIFPHFCIANLNRHEVSVTWLSDNPLVLQLTTQFVKPLSSDYQEDAARKKLERYWKDAEEGKTTDIQIRCDGKTFHAHKFFLLDVPFFKALLEDDKRVEVDLTEISKETFEQVLKFAYLGSLTELNSENNFDLLLDIFLAAHKYMEEALQQHVIDLIGMQLPTKINLEHKCKVLLQKGLCRQNDKLVLYALRLMNELPSLEFYAFIGGYNLKEVNQLIELARPLAHTKIVSRLNKAAALLKKQTELNTL